MIRKRRPVTSCVFALLSALLLMATRPAQAQTESVLYNFPVSYDNPYAQPLLAPDGAGNLFGVGGGGSMGFGFVFELSPSGSGGWNETTLYNFCSAPNCADGAAPNNYVSFDNLGNLYGTTIYGGANQTGVMFELSPVGSGWTETVLYSFGDVVTEPNSGLVSDPEGNFYGTCCFGEAVFELSPVGDGWTGQIIYNISPVSPSWAAVTMDTAGNIFGVTESTVFELPPNGDSGWNSAVIHTFAGEPKDGSGAFGTPVLDKDGNVYGTTYSGGTDNLGTVYKLSPITSGKKKGTWKEKILYSFKGGKKDGGRPYGGIAFDASGNLYGTTSAGGGRLNDGIVFELVAPVGKGSYKEKILWSFDGADGEDPSGGLILDAAGNLYGTTDLGGSGGGNDCHLPPNCGVVFEVIP